MKYALYSFSTPDRRPVYLRTGPDTVRPQYACRNLGDYIQELAALRFLPRCDAIIDRDRLSGYSGAEELCIIGNGWYDLSDGRHCYSQLIRMCPVSIHQHGPDLSQAPRLTAWLRRLGGTLPHGVGCRDLYTMELFRRHGIPAYFSSCLTTTIDLGQLEEKVRRLFRQFQRHQKPTADYLELRSRLQDLMRPLEHGHYLVTCDVSMAGMYNAAGWFVPEHAGHVATGWHHHAWALRRLRTLLAPYHTYPAVRLTHCISSQLTPWEGLATAYEVLRIYSHAALVVTSRLHAALPCLALGTPVLLLGERFDTRTRTYCDQNMVNFMEIETLSEHCDMQEGKKIVNPGKFRAYAEQLVATCTAFVQNTGSMPTPRPA